MMNWKFHVLGALYARWGGRAPDRDGYAILLLIPSDMPFLLRLGLEGLRAIDTTSCSEIIVSLDPFPEPVPGTIDSICRELHDPRLSVVRMGAKDRLVCRHVNHAVHWLQVVNAVRATRSRYAFLHDADAFFLEPEALERQYAECVRRNMHVLGVQARLDPFFAQLSMSIAGTWEMMFSTEWARRYAPILHRGYDMDTPHGRNMFDNTLYPQYLDYPTGKIGIMEPPPNFVHFSAAIFHYRRYRNFPERYEDSFCRLLVLSALEQAMLLDSGAKQVTPTVETLARGLKESDNTVTYLQDDTALRYAQTVRPDLAKLLATRLFDDRRRAVIDRLLAPFDAVLQERARALNNRPPKVPCVAETYPGVHTAPTSTAERRQRARANRLSSPRRAFHKAKRLPLQWMFRTWGAARPLEDGYAILLPTPMDMPFLLRLGLEGLRTINREHCRQILVVPDGWGDDRAAALKQVIGEFADLNVELVDLRWRDYKLIRAMRPPGCAATHWMMVVNGTRNARAKHCFLHDADAFWLERDGLERQYQESLRRQMYTLGVTARWDPFFQRLGYSIPGTWELLYSTEWALRRTPYHLKGRREETAYGPYIFDSMLHSQYADYPTGKVGVMADPPRFVHFSGTIFTYRLFRDRGQQGVADEAFQILLLALLETLVPDPRRVRVAPPVPELAKGLTDPHAAVLYNTEQNNRGYAEFRHMLSLLCTSPIMTGQRGGQLVELLEPFDRHFDFNPAAKYEAAFKHGDLAVARIARAARR